MFSRWNIFGRKETTVLNNNNTEQVIETMEVRGSDKEPEAVPIQEEKKVISRPQPTPIKKRAPSRRQSEAHSRRKTITPKKKVIKSRRKTLQPISSEKDKKGKGSTARDLRRVKRELKREEYFKNLKLERLEKELVASKRKLRELAEKEYQHHEEDEDIDMEENQEEEEMNGHSVNMEESQSEEELSDGRQRRSRRRKSQKHKTPSVSSEVSEDEDILNNSTSLNMSTMANPDASIAGAPEDLPDSIDLLPEPRERSTPPRRIQSEPVVPKRDELFLGFQQPLDNNTFLLPNTNVLVPNKPGALCVLRFEPGSPETAFHVEFPYSDIKVVEMSCGGKDRDIVILDDKGRVYVYDGWRKDYNKADQLQIVGKERVVKINSYATRNISLVTADGRVILVETDAYHQDAPFHTKENVPIINSLKIRETLQLPGEHIIAIEKFGGGEALLTKSGKIFTRGNNRYNLGYSLDLRSSQKFYQIEALKHEFITHISFSECHALAVTRNGNVFSWGCSDEGRLGLGFAPEAGIVVEPVLVESLKNQRVVKVSAGHFVSAFLTHVGKLYTCGSGKYMTLGHGVQRDEWLPREVERLAEADPLGEVIVDAGYCGFQLSAVTNQGRLYVCGMDSYTYAPGRDNQIWNTTLHPASFNIKNLYILRTTGSFVMGLLLGNPPVIEL
eukprot:TRINITY_DN8242_c0_g1_i1.p1 TRINITY_DN8242_c0_g1~~TRINITY_DN8242_c0_g1_i1.p1  ORF type:complete len:672 (-),score=124.87 TRINITY_DN8242_c0_g1_i1:30-2045(-)